MTGFQFTDIGFRFFPQKNVGHDVNYRFVSLTGHGFNLYFNHKHFYSWKRFFSMRTIGLRRRCRKEGEVGEEKGRGDWVGLDRLLPFFFPIIHRYEQNFRPFSKKSTASIICTFNWVVSQHKIVRIYRPYN